MTRTQGPGYPKRFATSSATRVLSIAHSGVAPAPAPVDDPRAHHLTLATSKDPDDLDAAYHANPERFVRGTPKPPPLPTAARVNKPATEETAH